MQDLPVRHVERRGDDLIIVLPSEVAERQRLREGDEVLVLRAAERATFEQALEAVLRDHAGTFEYLKDK